MEKKEKKNPKKVKTRQTKHKIYKTPSNYNFNCECGKNFTFKKHFNAHRRNIHNDSYYTPNSDMPVNNPHYKRCPLCDFSAKFRKEMINHYEVVHNISFVEKKYTFASEAEFSLWKGKIESDTNSKYAKKETRTSSECQITDFYCHRSGYYVSKGKGLRSLKTQGSVKMNSFCPSRILLKCSNKDGTCIVCFSGTHVGHQNELKYLTLTLAEKEELAKKIALKIPFDDILDQVRGSIYECSVQRINLLTRRDLYNIEMAYNLQTKTVRHKDDVISVDAWVREMENKEAVEENSDSLVTAESESDKNCELAVCELSKSKPFCQDVDKRKKKLQNAILKTFSTVSNIEEIKILEKIYSQASNLLAAIGDKTSPPFQSKQAFVANKNIVSQRRFSSKKKESKKTTKKLSCNTSAEIKKNAVGL